MRISQGLCSKYGLLQQSICYRISKCINFIIWVFVDLRAAFLSSDFMNSFGKEVLSYRKTRNYYIYLLLYNSNFFSINNTFFLSKLLKCIFRMLKTLLVAAGYLEFTDISGVFLVPVFASFFAFSLLPQFELQRLWLFSIFQWKGCQRKKQDQMEF